MGAARRLYEPDPAASGHKAGEREVRLTSISVIRDHLQDPNPATAWCRYHLDFNGVIFDGGTFDGSNLGEPVSFKGAAFSGGTVSFAEATFGGTLSFVGAVLDGTRIFFDRAAFDGPVTFQRASFDGGTVDLGDATFSGTACIWGSVPAPLGA